MEHSEKLKQLEESRQLRRLGGMVIYPVADQQGCAMAPFAFAQVAEPVALQKPRALNDGEYQKRDPRCRNGD